MPLTRQDLLPGECERPTDLSRPAEERPPETDPWGWADSPRRRAAAPPSCATFEPGLRLAAHLCEYRAGVLEASYAGRADDVVADRATRLVADLRLFAAMLRRAYVLPEDEAAWLATLGLPEIKVG